MGSLAAQGLNHGNECGDFAEEEGVCNVSKLFNCRTFKKKEYPQRPIFPTRNVRKF